jgi:arabinofuranosyltransferase
LLIAACVGAALAAWRWNRLPQRLGWLARSLGVFLGLVVTHLLFRRAYYGEWVPNTYYAKVGGSSWWAPGLEYLAAFALEYAVYLWIPLLVAAVLYHRRRSTLLTPIVVAAVVVPHAMYVASIGGDHFEYRPLDVYLPLLFILVFFGAVELARGPWGRRWVGLYLALVLIGIVELPYRSHVQFLGVYAPGFPGIDLGKHVEADQFLAPERSPIYGLPGLRALAAAHRQLIVRATSRFVGIRQEEHALFLETAIAEARDLRRLIDGGVIPKDTHIAVDCVGAIPYYTGLRVLDRLGLTDAHVAHGPFVRDMMAHGKQATPEYARESGVDLWAENPVHLLWRLDDPRFLRRLYASYPRQEERFFADVGNGQFLLAWFPQGPERARSRFPTLKFESTHDQAAIERIAAAVREAHDR